ncbi:MAG: nitrate/nitrite transporter NrtS [Ekhidna sp.]|nr:nitrate/nitrite transporter NrtS [Ekhidna sp.]
MTLGNTVDSLKIAIVVGTILSIINQYDVLISWDFTLKDHLRIFLNYLVPFCVATLSREMHIRKENKNK